MQVSLEDTDDPEKMQMTLEDTDDSGRCRCLWKMKMTQKMEMTPEDADDPERRHRLPHLQFNMHHVILITINICLFYF